MKKKVNSIAKGRLDKYKRLTTTALGIVKKKIVKGKEAEAKEIIDMVSNYISDAEHFEKKGHDVNAFAAFNYAHGWLDCGVRLGVFDVHDNKLFTVA